MKRFLALLLALSVWIHGPGPVHAAQREPQAPTSARERGEAAFAAGEWATAAEAFAEAHAEDGNPAFLYAQAQSVRKSGDCRGAIELYAAFLETKPPAGAERNARDNMAECAREVAAQPVPDPVAETPLQPVDPDPDPDPDPEGPQSAPLPPPWYTDPIGGVLLGFGVVGLATGGGLYGQARADEQVANEASTEPEYVDRIHRASAFSRAGIAVLAIGGVALVSAVVRYVIVDARRRRATGGAPAPRDARGPGVILRF